MAMGTYITRRRGGMSRSERASALCEKLYDQSMRVAAEDGRGKESDMMCASGAHDGIFRRQEVMGM